MTNSALVSWTTPPEEVLSLVSGDQQKEGGKKTEEWREGGKEIEISVKD